MLDFLPIGSVCVLEYSTTQGKDMSNQQQNADLKLEALTKVLQSLGRQELADLWLKQYKHSPPKGTKRGLLERAEAYRLQAKRFDKLKQELRRQLIAIATSSEGHSKASQSASLGPGSKLVREWHGKTHHVIVTDTGYFWNNKTYQSLSAIAFAITGVKWSGPRFFGTNK